MLKIILPYIPLHTDVGFLLSKQDYLHIGVWRTAFFIHVFSSLFALLAGFTQFSRYLLRSNPKLHRRLGFIYVFNVLFITGPSGLVMSYYANGGIIAITGFLLLSILWITFTATAFFKAIQKDFTAHRAFMIRSYALTLSALSLRAWKVLLEEFTPMSATDRYQLIAWLGWGLNLLIAEVIISQLIRKRRIISSITIRENAER